MVTTQKLLLAAAGSGGTEGVWIYSYRTTSTSEVTSLGLHSGGNIMAMDRLNKNFISLSPEGALLNLYHFDIAARDIATRAGSSSFVAVGQDTRGSAGYSDAIIVGYGGTGSLQGQRLLGDPIIDGANAVTYDPDGDYLYYTGFTEQGSVSSPDTYGLLAKYSSGLWSNSSFQFNKRFHVPSASLISVSPKGIAATSTDDIVCVGSVIGGVSGGGVREGFVISFGDTGAINWSTTISGSDSYQFYGVAIDSSGNIYAAGDNDTDTSGILVKLNSSGAFQWGVELNGSGSTNFRGVAVDSEDNVYVVGQTDPGSDEAILFAKYDSSGNLQWGRTVRGTHTTAEGLAITVDSNDDLYVGGKISVDSSLIGGIVLKAPSSGEISGAYGNFTIGGGGVTSSSVSPTATSGLWSSSNVFLTEQAALSEPTITEYALKEIT